MGGLGVALFKQGQGPELLVPEAICQSLNLDPGFGKFQRPWQEAPSVVLK